MPNRPGRPKGGPNMEERLSQYLACRERGLTYDEVAEAMNVSRAAICQYARRLRDTGNLPQTPNIGIRAAQRSRETGYEAKVTDYAALRASGVSPEDALSRIELKPARENVRRYEYAYRHPGERLPQPQEPRAPSRYRVAVLEHLREWPSSLFSANDLERVLAPALGVKRADSRPFRTALTTLAAQGVVEVVEGVRYPGESVPARRYRLASSTEA